MPIFWSIIWYIYFFRITWIRMFRNWFWILFLFGFINCYSTWCISLFILISIEFWCINLSTPIKLFWNNIFISKTKINFCIASFFNCIIMASSISTIYVIISFQPLNKLKIVLIFCSSQFLYLNISFNTSFLKATLEKL